MYKSIKILRDLALKKLQKFYKIYKINSWIRFLWLYGAICVKKKKGKEKEQGIKQFTKKWWRSIKRNLLKECATQFMQSNK